MDALCHLASLGAASARRARGARYLAPRADRHSQDSPASLAYTRYVHGSLRVWRGFAHLGPDRGATGTIQRGPGWASGSSRGRPLRGNLGSAVAPMRSRCTCSRLRIFCACFSTCAATASALSALARAWPAQGWPGKGQVQLPRDLAGYPTLSPRPCPNPDENDHSYSNSHREVAPAKGVSEFIGGRGGQN